VQEKPSREYCYIITFSAGTTPVVYSGTYVPAPGMTRHEVFLKIREDCLNMLPGLARLNQADVCFFSLEPNELP
jgi:hypothetical protein